MWQKCDSSRHKVLVVSVCPQSLPFFAVKFHLDVLAVAQKLCGFLKSVGESACRVARCSLSPFFLNLNLYATTFIFKCKCMWQCITLTGSRDQWLNNVVSLPKGKLEMFSLCLQE